MILKITFAKMSRVLIGFWRWLFDTETDVDKYPYPIKDSNSLTKEETELFLEKMEEIEEKSKIEYYLGYSQCRICLQENGSRQFYYTKRDKTWIFPEGYSHYIKVHNVKIDDDFYKIVMDKDESRFNIEDID